MSETAIETPAAEVQIDPVKELAKNGVYTSGDTPVNTPAPQITKEPAKPEAKPEEKKVEATSSTPAPDDKPAQQQSQKVEQPVQAAEIDWREVLKKQPESDVLKELGLDEKLMGLINTWKSGGNVNAYVGATSIDYSKMSGEQLMRHDLKANNPDLSDEDFEILYHAKVTDAYKLDPTMYDEKDVKRGRILINSDSRPIRDRLMENQKKYIIDSKPPEPKPDPKVIEAQERRRLEVENYQKEIKESPTYKGITGDKKLPIEINGETYNHTIPDPANVDGVLFDANKWSAAMKTPDGKWDARKVNIISTIATDFEGFFKGLADHFIGVGKAQAIKPIENLSNEAEQKHSAGPPPLSPEAALAKYGTYSG